MNASTTATAALTLAMLPALGGALEDGIFAGISTTKDGVHAAVVLLPGKADDVSWKAAADWAKEQGGELPTRPVAALLFANAQQHLKPEWHWTSEEAGASWAWHCHFGNGSQGSLTRSSELSAVAVRLIPLSA